MTFSLLPTNVAFAADGYDGGNGSENNPYQIRTLEQLEYFRDQVNNGSYYGNDKYFKLTADIDMSSKYGENASSWTPIGIGENKKKFESTFDGGGFMIKNLYSNTPAHTSKRGETMYYGLFGHVLDGTIKNLGVSGKVTGTNYVSGVAGYIETGSVIKCYSKCTVEGNGYNIGGVVGGVVSGESVTGCYNDGKVVGYSDVGGVVGCLYGGYITNCYNTGDVEGTCPQNASGSTGGVLGYLSYSTPNVVKNCYNIGSVSANRNIGGVIGYSSSDNATIENCYYLEGKASGGIKGSDIAGKAEAKTSTQFSQGEVACLLQGEQSEQVWGQALSGTTDNYPVLTSEVSKKVYAIYTDCSQKTFVKYSNTDTNISHKFENGVCNNVLGDPHYQPAELEDGVYKISNGGQLVWFASLVNGSLDGTAQNQSANAKLAADIDMSGIEGYVPIGGTTGLYYKEDGDDKGYSGTFDGGGHIIKNLSPKAVSGTELTYGVFGTLSGTVKNLGVENFSFVLEDTDCRVGAVAGQILSGGSVENCYAANVNINTKNKVAGGIAGSSYSGTVTNCFSYKTNITSSRTGGILGDNRGDIDENDRLGTMNNCYTDSAVLNYNKNNGNVENCEAGVSGYDFASGRIAYLLNGSSSSGIWKQNLGENKDLFPNFKGEAVYQTTGCVTYTNTEPSGEKEHNYKNGVCADCGDYGDSAATLKDGVYEISTAGELLWFADKVNGGESTICAKLADDIDATAAKRINIGADADKAFKGTFDGNGKTLTVALETLGNNKTEDNTAVFGIIEGATVKNLTVRGSIAVSVTADTEDTARKNVGGAVGLARGGATIDNVVSYVNISDTGKTANLYNKQIGGVCGYLESSVLKNCEYWGDINMQISQTTGGVVGCAVDSSTVSNCVNYGKISSVGDAKHIGGVAADAQTGTKVEKCVNYGDVTSGGTDCISGVVAYANQNVRIENCANVGKITCTANSYGYIGGILGYINNANFKGIENCYNYGAIVTNEGYAIKAGAIIGWNRNSGDVYKNNFYLKDSCSSGYGTNGNAITATVKDKSAFESGEVAYLLGSAWGQDLEKKDYPVPNGKKIYLYASIYSNEEPSFKIWEAKSESNKMKATISAPKAGTYKVVFADYENGILKNFEAVDAVFCEGEYVVLVTAESDMTLSSGGKVMLWSDLSGLTPLCEAFEVK